MKKLFFISLLILLVSLPGYFLLGYFSTNKEEVVEEKKEESVKRISNGNITVEYEYKGDNLYDYYLYANIPSCYTKSVLVWSDDEAEPYSNVKIKLITGIPSLDCKDDISKYEYRGNFNAKENVNFEIVSLEESKLGND